MSYKRAYRIYAKQYRLKNKNSQTYTKWQNLQYEA